MSVVVQLNERRPIRAIYSVMVYRNPDGSLFASLDWADEEWVKDNGNSRSSRMHMVADNMPECANAVRKQAEEWECLPDDLDGAETIED